MTSLKFRLRMAKRHINQNVSSCPLSRSEREEIGQLFVVLEFDNKKGSRTNQSFTCNPR